MNSLKPQHLMHLNAAEGWLELGNPIEAHEELEKITPALHSHPDVLDVRYRICAQAKRWGECVEIAEAILQIAPESLLGWIRRSNALSSLKRTQEALEELLLALDYFPQEIVVRYNLGCYECALGNISRAKLRLSEVFMLAHHQRCFDKWRLQALNDPDLEALRGYLQEVEI